MTTEDEASFATDTQFVVLEQTQHVSVWPEPVLGAGHEATADVTNLTLSMDQHHEEDIVTFPRYKQFVSDSKTNMR